MLRGATRARRSLAIQRLLRGSAVSDCDLAGSQGARPNGASSNKTAATVRVRVSRLQCKNRARLQAASATACLCEVRVAELRQIHAAYRVRLIASRTALRCEGALSPTVLPVRRGNGRFRRSLTLLCPS